MTKQTDEINNETFATDSETHTGGYQNEWGEKLNEWAPDAAHFNAKFSRTELGDGQLMSVEECAKQVSTHQARERAGQAANAQLDADLQWADVRVKEERLTGKQLERGIYRAKNVQLGNELAYQVGLIALHGEKRHLQLQGLSQEVQQLRGRVKANANFIRLESGAETSEEIDFNSINVEVDEV